MSTFFADPATLTHSALEQGEVFAPRFDAAGLVTVVTVSHTDNAVLMVAHMNALALRSTLETGYAHYWSRSRQALWKKGESSGELQKLVEMRTDCDQDALVLVVDQQGTGAACHTGRRTCFYRRVRLDGGDVGIEDTGEPVLFDPEAVYRS